MAFRRVQLRLQRVARPVIHRLVDAQQSLLPPLLQTIDLHPRFPAERLGRLPPNNRRTASRSIAPSAPTLPASSPVYSSLPSSLVAQIDSILCQRKSGPPLMRVGGMMDITLDARRVDAHLFSVFHAQGVRTFDDEVIDSLPRLRPDARDVCLQRLEYGDLSVPNKAESTRTNRIRPPGLQITVIQLHLHLQHRESKHLLRCHSLGARRLLAPTRCVRRQVLPHALIDFPIRFQDQSDHVPLLNKRENALAE